MFVTVIIYTLLHNNFIIKYDHAILWKMAECIVLL